MSERKLVGTVQTDSGEIAIVDPTLILQMEDFLKVSTGVGEGTFPVYFFIGPNSIIIRDFP